MFRTGRSGRFFRMALWASVVAFVAVVFNAYSRLSEAGLGCPDWPGCYGVLFAPATAQDVNRTRTPEDMQKLEKKRAAQETFQRLLAGILSLTLFRLAWLGWQLKKRKRSQQVLIPLFTLGAVVGLSVAGFLTFEHRFRPLVQMMQVLGGMSVLALLWWIVLREQRLFRSVADTPLARSLRPRALIALVLVSGQIALGGWSMVNYAGLACPDFPTCQSSWWPDMDFLQAFTLWRDLGLDYGGENLTLPGTTALHMAHRIGALMTVLYVGWLSLYLLRVGFQEKLCRYGLLLLVMLLFAAALGVMEVVAHLPIVLAVAHNAVAALLLMSVVTLYHVNRAPPRTA
jgi:cytochrome c oxidase assembly protein subunit 15